MSAQDYPVMFVSGRAPTNSARWPFVQLLFQTAKVAMAEIARRHALWKLTVLDDAQLRDYGVDRNQLVKTLEAPLTVNATKSVEKARALNARRSN
ncbi:MAG: hypothetical protein AAFY99_01660 [Pseudomonadota bacterium]